MDSNSTSRRRRGRGGNRNGRGGSRTGSSSSNSSSSRSNPNRPTPKHSIPPPARLQTSVQTLQLSHRVDSPLASAAQSTSPTLDGHVTHQTEQETDNTRPDPTASPQSLEKPTLKGGSRIQINSGRRTNPCTPVPSLKGNFDGTSHYETRMKIYDLPRSYYTKDVYDAMSSYGTVIRIEMSSRGSSNSASIVFRPPLSPTAFPSRHVKIGKVSVRWEIFDVKPNMVPSPVNPLKKYQENYIIPAKSISFGVQTGKTEMISMRTFQSGNDFKLVLNLMRKQLDVHFSVEVDDDLRKARFQLPFALLSRIYTLSHPKDHRVDLIIPFTSVPQFFMRRKENALLEDGKTYTSFSPKDRQWNDWDTWFRETDIIQAAFEQRLRKMPVMNHKDTAIIDIGRWTAYRITIDGSTCATPMFTEFKCALVDHGITIQAVDSYAFRDYFPAPIWNLLQEEITGTHPHLDPSSHDFDNLLASQIHLPFSVRYQLEVCLSNGYIKEHTITEDFLRKLSSIDSEHAVAILEKVVDKQNTFYEPMEIFKMQIRNCLEKKVPNYCVLQRSVSITPTMMHVSTPIMETTNRIIRKYAADSDRFIRVRFSDEKTEGPLHNMPNDRAAALFDRVGRAMKNGIVVAGRYYEFLAFGNSQFRQHGAYFYAPTLSKSAEDIRSSLGEFSHIKTVAKFGARLGQCFSTTRAIRVSVKICEIPDVTRNGYNFTDGVGKISFFLAQMAAQELGLSNAWTDPPTLYQFRLGGSKGVLALDPSISGNEVHIRPSQKKFIAEYMGLEIIRSSALATPFFNRQIIIVLSDLGVMDNIFLKKQQDMINDYEQAMTDESIALQKLRRHVDQNQTTITMAGLILDGFMKTKEPFFMSLLKLWRACTIKNLKEKARIAIDDGAFVLGCVDETATLKGHFDDQAPKPGATSEEKLATLPEIFLQIDDTTKRGHYKIVEGICILARNPSLHPGDVRIVRAVDVPALRHLKNVVVFPQTGDRDLANMCSGGDLDGDDYLVLWDVDLIPRDINEPPMDFTSEKPFEMDGPITVGDIGNFFVTYMKNDSLGHIAHAHLAQADSIPEGVKSETCLKLAELHSQAVDYPKSGIPAVMQPRLRPAKWPHFMEKRHVPPSKVYKSRNILGQLYDHVQLVDFKPQWENSFDDRILGAFDLDRQTLDKATEIKLSYDEALRRLMAKHGIRTEFEAWSVFVLQHNHESRDYKFAEEFGRTIGALKAQYREICMSAAGVHSMIEWSRLAPFIAAMYTITAEEMKGALNGDNEPKTMSDNSFAPNGKDPEQTPLISFPWLFPEELGKIANGSKPVHVDEPMQYRHSRPKRRPTYLEDPGVIGTVQTTAGVTNVGELLNLDFASGTTADQAKTTSPSNPSPFAVSEPKPEPIDLAIPTSDLHPVTLQNLSISQDTIIPLSKEGDIEQATTLHIKLDLNKSSVMNRL